MFEDMCYFTPLTKFGSIKNCLTTNNIISQSDYYL